VIGFLHPTSLETVAENAQTARMPDLTVPATLPSIADEVIK
jgi:hypothetical protein